MARHSTMTSFAGYAIGAGFFAWCVGLGAWPLLTTAAAVCIGHGALRGVHR